MNPIPTLEQTLREGSADAAPALVQPEKDMALRCLACGHRCLIRPGRSGVCYVRHNDNGVLRVPSGYVAGLQIDPIEKKPFFMPIRGTMLCPS